jgi:hypothetical protein
MGFINQDCVQIGKARFWQPLGAAKLALVPELTRECATEKHSPAHPFFSDTILKIWDFEIFFSKKKVKKQHFSTEARQPRPNCNSKP